jgi:hypothetical protein
MNRKLYSQNRLSQAFWVTCSVILGLILSDLTKEIIVPSISGNDIARWKLWLAIPSFIFCLLSVVECYPWLNPTKQKVVSGRELFFDLLALITFVMSTVAQYGMLYALRKVNNSQNIVIKEWLYSLLVILLFFLFYNVILIFKNFIFFPKISKQIDKYDLHQGGKHGMPASIFYLLWAASIFFIVKEPGNFRLTAPFAFIVFLIYFFSYLWFWWEDWHDRAYRDDA